MFFISFHLKSQQQFIKHLVCLLLQCLSNQLTALWAWFCLITSSCASYSPKYSGQWWLLVCSGRTNLVGSGANGLFPLYFFGRCARRSHPAQLVLTYQLFPDRLFFIKLDCPILYILPTAQCSADTRGTHGTEATPAYYSQPSLTLRMRRCTKWTLLVWFLPSFNQLRTLSLVMIVVQMGCLGLVPASTTPWYLSKRQWRSIWCSQPPMLVTDLTVAAYRRTRSATVWAPRQPRTVD